MALGEMNSGNEKLPEWSEVQNKPPEFNPSKHFHNFIVDDGDNRDSNTAPSDYYGDKDNDDCHGKMIFRGIKKTSAVNLSAGGNGYCFLLGLCGWKDYTGGYSYEIAFCNRNIYYRPGANDSWGNWAQIATA